MFKGSSGKASSIPDAASSVGGLTDDPVLKSIAAPDEPFKPGLGSVEGTVNIKHFPLFNLLLCC